MFQTEVAEKIKTHISCSVNPCPKKHASYVIRKNAAELDRPQTTI